MQQRSVRALVALLIIFGYLSVMVAAVSPGHLHNAKNPHSCAVCQVSLTPFDTAVSGPSVAPPQASDHGVSSRPVRLYAGRQSFSGSARAPPRA
ncbi:MAG TPA: hypothetical protein VER03_15125 [Bryobacteraceae bacterium]|nr:hypothetical protein [Bryobacteraceae bacterium]